MLARSLAILGLGFLGGEFVLSLRNERRLRAQGAVEVRAAVTNGLALFYLAAFIGPFLESAERPAPAWTAAWAVLFLLAKLLKLWTIASLGPLWTERLLIPPDFRIVTGGPFRYLRHPNYLAAIIEILAFPAALGSWASLLVAAPGFFVLLVLRIRAEEKTLRRLGPYDAALEGRGRFWPKL